MSDIIEISHVTKKYGAATVLNDVNISFEKGKIKNSYGWTKDGFDYEKFKKWLEEEL